MALFGTMVSCINQVSAVLIVKPMTASNTCTTINEHEVRTGPRRTVFTIFRQGRCLCINYTDLSSLDKSNILKKEVTVLLLAESQRQSEKAHSFG